ncbi:MAG: hypothetical protein WBD53_17720 [Xanthobacteraceae bacterium]
MLDYECMALAKMFRYYRQHGLIGNANTLSRLLKRPPQDFADFAVRLAAR